MSGLQNFTTKKILNNHRERCLSINDTQADKYETGIIKFKNYNKQIVDSYRKLIYPRLPLKLIFYSSIDDGKRDKGHGHISTRQYSHLKGCMETI